MYSVLQFPVFISPVSIRPGTRAKSEFLLLAILRLFAVHVDFCFEVSSAGGRFFPINSVGLECCPVSASSRTLSSESVGTSDKPSFRLTDRRHRVRIQIVGRGGQIRLSVNRCSICDPAEASSLQLPLRLLRLIRPQQPPQLQACEVIADRELRSSRPSSDRCRESPPTAPESYPPSLRPW